MAENSVLAPLTCAVMKMHRRGRSALLYAVFLVPVLCTFLSLQLASASTVPVSTEGYLLLKALFTALFLLLNSYLRAARLEREAIAHSLEQLAVGNLNLDLNSVHTHGCRDTADTLQFLLQELALAIHSTRKSSDWIGALGHQLYTNSKQLDHETQ